MSGVPKACRLLVEPLPSTLEPARALLAFAGDHYPFALLGAWAGGSALLGSDPVAIHTGLDPFAALDQQPEVQGPPSIPGGTVGGGWVGYLGYQLAHRLTRLPPPPPRLVPLPAAVLCFYDHMLRFDGQAWWFEALATPSRERFLLERLNLFRQRLCSPALFPTSWQVGPFACHPIRERQLAAVARCLAHIAAGDIFQANLCLRLHARFAGSAAALFAHAVRQLGPPYAAWLAGPQGQLVSLSPELFLHRQGRQIRSAPIKGTIPCDPDPHHANTQREQLLASAKNQAENVMIVDLVRNDLGRICRNGTVHVPALLRAERHPGLWHLVSDVAGELADEVGDDAVLRACFPPGSVTGAPKVRAMQLINRLESTAREVYTGAIGYASPLAGLELSVAIRTFETARGRIWLGAGGGITAGSQPAAEHDEALAKAIPLIAAIGGTITNDIGAVPAPM